MDLPALYSFAGLLSEKLYQLDQKKHALPIDKDSCVGEVLLKGIKSRIKARQLEDQYIEAYENKNGRMPRGNRK